MATRPGQAYRLFPFGVIYKNGKRREITPEFASKFKLPHFKPPIKLRSHDDPTPAGGHIIGLEVRADGLYAVPEWNEQGESANAKGAYRYHSPEVIWEDSALENPLDGSAINGPIILGDAMLHTPHLGEAAALYSIEPITEANKMEENITFPKSFYDKYIVPLFAKEPTDFSNGLPIRDTRHRRRDRHRVGNRRLAARGQGLRRVQAHRRQQHR